MCVCVCVCVCACMILCSFINIMYMTYQHRLRVS